MNDDFEEDETPAGDAWASCVTRDHSAEESWLAKLEREFLERGGVIQQIETGATAIDYGARGTPSINNDRYTVEEQLAYRQRKDAQAAAKHSRVHEPFIGPINAAMDTAQSQLELAERVGISPNKLRRILRTHFASDPRLTKFLKEGSQLDREDVVRRARAAIRGGVIGLGNLAEAVGVSKETLRRLSVEDGLIIPLAAPGRRSEVQA